MQNLQIVEYQSKRVLTTHQLAEVYETEVTNVQTNFTRNRDRFISGRDYYVLDGDELKEFKSNHTNSMFASNLNKLILWTERGANRHSKILDTDKAWQQFDILEETYFQVKSNMIPQELTRMEILQLAIESEKKVLELQTTLDGQKSKVVFAESVECSKSSILVKGLAIILNQNGVDIGQNRLFDYLRDNGYLCKQKGKNYNKPNQRSLDLKVMEEKTTTINKPDRDPIITNTPMITGKGILYFVDKFLNKSVLEIV